MKSTLKKELNLTDVSLATAGYIIGAGIYAIIGIASKYGKNYTWISILISGISAICTGLSYSELATMFNQNAGEYIYIKEAFNGNVASFVAYLIILAEILTQSTVAIGLGEHLNSLIPINAKILSSSLLLIFGYLNYFGIRESINYNNATTIMEISGLLIISLFGLKYVNKDSFDISNLNYKDLYPLLVGASIINFAYFGYDMAIELTEETKDSINNIPKGMLIGVLISTILYGTVTVSSISSIGWEKLASSNTPLTDVAHKLLGAFGGKMMLLIALISMSNTLLMGSVAGSRFIQSFSKNIELPFNLQKIDKKTNTPINAIIFITIVSIIGVFIGNLEKVTSLTNISTISIFILMNLSVIVMRFTKPNHSRHFKVPFNINNVPVPSLIGLISSVIFIFVTISNL
jgi:basic amino acid/polyamine antiporter, APA family